MPFCLQFATITPSIDTKCKKTTNLKYMIKKNMYLCTHESKKGWYEETIIIICDSAHYFCTPQ